MDVSKMSLSELDAKRKTLINDIKMFERDLERFPGSSFLGHFYLTKCIEYRQKTLKKVIEEIERRKY
jgi:hypothetical protein